MAPDHKDVSKKRARLDVLLVERGLAPSTTRAQARILAGHAFVDGQRVDKAGTAIKRSATIELRGDENPFVSRGGIKLEHALRTFGYDVTDRVVIDVGASTGGFTDCVLQRGARRVYAVDVGYGQLAWRLRHDERVVNMERTNVRHLAHDDIPEPCDLAVVDCSFISLHKVLPGALQFLPEGADVIALIKPQFEAQREAIGRGGVVRDEEARAQAIEDAIAQAHKLGLTLVQGADSTLAGPAGNVEYLAWFRVTDKTALGPGEPPRDQI